MKHNWTFQDLAISHVSSVFGEEVGVLADKSTRTQARKAVAPFWAWALLHCSAGTLELRQD